MGISTLFAAIKALTVNMFKEGGPYRIFERIREINYKEPPYSTRYPELLNIYEDGDPAIARENKIVRNISYGNKFLYLSEGLDFSIVTVKDNLIADQLL